MPRLELDAGLVEHQVGVHAAPPLINAVHPTALDAEVALRARAVAVALLPVVVEHRCPDDGGLAVKQTLGER